jgi:nucleoid DNA-binding protein
MNSYAVLQRMIQKNVQLKLFEEQEQEASMKLSWVNFCRMIANETNIGRKYVEEVLEAAGRIMAGELLAHRHFSYPGLGTFQPKVHGPRKVRTQLTGWKTVNKPAHTVVNFRPTRPLKEALDLGTKDFFAKRETSVKAAPR